MTTLEQGVSHSDGDDDGQTGTVWEQGRTGRKEGVEEKEGQMARMKVWREKEGGEDRKE